MAQENNQTQQENTHSHNQELIIKSLESALVFTLDNLKKVYEYFETFPDKTCLVNGENVNKRDVIFKTINFEMKGICSVATLQNDLVIVKCSAESTDVCDRNNAFYLACEYGFFEIMKFLYETILECTNVNKCVDIAQVVFGKGLKIAFDCKHTKIVKFLLDEEIEIV